jgi:CO dehydrogenase maturation factor
MGKPKGQKEGNVLAVGGKGGVGKTSVSAILVKLFLSQKDRGLLVIDADPVISVAYALGERPEKTIGDYRETLIEDPAESRAVRKRPMKSVIRDLVTRSKRGYDLLVMGRAEARGCFCGINELLRFGIEALCGEYGTALIDCEAGIEQVNRRAVHRIDDLLLVTDTSRRGFESVVHVRDIAVKYNEDGAVRAHVLVNRVRNKEEEAYVKALSDDFGLHLRGIIPEDPNVLEYNSKGRPLIDLPDDSPSVIALADILRNLTISASTT